MSTHNPRSDPVQAGPGPCPRPASACQTPRLPWQALLRSALALPVQTPAYWHVRSARRRGVPVEPNDVQLAHWTWHSLAQWQRPGWVVQALRVVRQKFHHDDLFLSLIQYE